MAPIDVSQDTLDWLCCEENQPVRCLALTRLLGREVLRYVIPGGKQWYEQLSRHPTLPRSLSADPRKRSTIVAAKRAWLAERGGPPERVEKAGWRRFGFPLHYNSDALEALRALVQAGVSRRTPRVRLALDLVLERRRPDGRWNLDHSFNGRMIADVEKKGAPSRWITLHALEALGYFRGLKLP